VLGSTDASLELLAGAFADALAQHDRRGGVERLELVEDAGALRDCGTSGDQQRPQRKENAATARDRDVLVGERGLGGGQRVDAIRLAGPAFASTWMLDLHHGVATVL
jgi:hypothetical protein